MSRSLARLVLSLLVCSGGFHVAQAQTAPLLDEVHTIAAATTAVPVEHTFTITTAGDYNITLTDVGALLTPSAPLASVELAVAANDVLVGTPLVGAGTLLLKSLQPGTYQYDVVGMPGTVAGSGPIGVQVVSASGGAAIAGYSDTLAVPGAALTSETTLDGTFTVSSAGSYQVSLTDLQIPASLPTLTLTLVEAGTGALLAILPDPTSGADQATVQLTTGVNYRVFAGAKASTTAGAGLFSVTVAPAGGGASVYQATQPVGTFTSLGNTPTLNSGPYTVTLTDLATPVALTQLTAVLIQNGAAAVTLSAAGSQNFNAAGGVYQVLALGTPAATPGTGSYALAVQPQGGTPVMSLARAVAAPGGSSSAYSYDTTVTTAGSYVLDLADFTFPKLFSSIKAMAVQNGVILGTPLAAAGTAPVTPAAGPVSLLVFAQADPVEGGLFGIDLTPSAGGTSVFATTQGVGQLYYTQSFNVTSSGLYTVSVSDLGFPAPFANLAAIVTQGSQQVGQIYVAGTFQFTAALGNYIVTFVAQPNTTAAEGTFALNVSLAPTVTLQASATSVTAGGTVTLKWGSQNATACVASGGWSGSEALSGSATSPVINTTTTFTLTCSGPGGSQAQSVTVSATPAQKSKGGGGALDMYVVLFLASLVLLQWVGRREVR
jgi:hypothetical protein